MADLDVASMLRGGGGVDLFGLTPEQINQVTGRRAQANQLAQQVIGAVLTERNREAAARRAQTSANLTRAGQEAVAQRFATSQNLAERKEARLKGASEALEQGRLNRQKIIDSLTGSVPVGGQDVPVRDIIDALGPSGASLLRNQAPSRPTQADINAPVTTIDTLRTFVTDTDGNLLDPDNIDVAGLNRFEGVLKARGEKLSRFQVPTVDAGVFSGQKNSRMVPIPIPEGQSAPKASQIRATLVSPPYNYSNEEVDLVLENLRGR